MCAPVQLNLLNSFLAIVYTVFCKCEKIISEKNAFKVLALAARNNDLYGLLELKFLPDAICTRFPHDILSIKPPKKSFFFYQLQEAPPLSRILIAFWAWGWSFEEFLDIDPFDILSCITVFIGNIKYLLNYSYIRCYNYSNLFFFCRSCKYWIKNTFFIYFD